jgi:hypothetical protein
METCLLEDQLLFLYFAVLGFQNWDRLCEKRKEAEGIFMHLCTTVDLEPDVYEVSIRTLFTIVREFRL